MAFTRKFLSAMGVEADKIEEIMTAHIEVVEHFKSQLDETKSLSDELDTLKTANADLTKQLKDATDKITAYEKEDYKGKYESEKTEHDKLKADVAGKETLAKTNSAIEAVLRETKFSDEATKLILRKGNYQAETELDKDGNVKDKEALLKKVQSDFSMLYPKETVTSSTTDNPPLNGGGNAFEKMSLGEKMKYANENPNDSAVLSWIGRK